MGGNGKNESPIAVNAFVTGDANAPPTSVFIQKTIEEDNMQAEDNEQISVKRLKNRLTKVKEKIKSRQYIIENNREMMDPRRLIRWEKAIINLQTEKRLLSVWIAVALRNGGIFTYRKRSPA